jgi:hypothetical protein
MKTKLLLLFLTIASFVNVQAQVILDPVSSNITSNSATISATLYGNGTFNTFYQLATGNANNVASSANQGDQLMPGVYALVNLSRNLSGLLPNTTYNYRFVASASGVANQFSSIGSFTTASLTPDISAISTSVTSNSANINYTINPKTSATTSVIKYGYSASTLNTQLAGFSAPANTNTSGTTTLSNLLVNTLYFYQIDATNADGTTSSNIGNFHTNTAEQIIAEYTFDNTLNNVNGNTPFDTKTGMFYVPNRFGATDKALYINGTGTSATIPDLPVNNSSRSISIWIRPTQVNNDNVIFTYGTGSGNFAYGASFNSTTMFNFSYSTNLSYATSTVVNNWKHMVYTYEQSTGVAKIYIDGVLKNSGTFSAWSTGNYGVFYLGSLFGSGSEYKGYVDDLKIYNYAISAADVTALFTSTTLATSENTNTTKDISIYPNPAKDFVNIQSEKRVQTIEIYNMAGQKVLETKETKINTSNLKPGVYMVKIKDVKNQMTSKKLIIK